MGINILEEKFAFLSGGVVVEDRGATIRNREKKAGDIRAVNAGSTSARIMEWGPDNCLPNYREALAAENNIVPTLMKTRRNITLGLGLMAYRKSYVDGVLKRTEVEIPEEAKAFFKRSEINKYLSTACMNEIMHAGIPTEYLRKGDRKISRIRALQCRHFRLGEMDSRGRIREAFWKGNWGKAKRTKNQQAQRIPFYLPERQQAKFCTFEVDDLLCLDEYYPMPSWQGSEEWIILANKIPRFHDANLAHGYTIRFHIKIPKGYFFDATKEYATDKQKEDAIGAASEKKRTFVEKINATLQGLDNAGKTIVTEYDVLHDVAKEYPGIVIDPINYDMKDTALIELFNASNAANMSAQGVHPTLANIQTQGKLSSGSEIRNAFTMYVAIHTPSSRERLLRPINLVKEINGWDPEIFYGFKDLEISKLDEEKSGKKENTETPTAE